MQWWFLSPPGAVFHGHCLPASLLHGSLLMDAGGGASPLEQGGSSQHERRQEDEILLRDRLGYLQLLCLESSGKYYFSFLIQDMHNCLI